VQGERALKQFKADAKAATDPAQRAALEQFADALAGALHRQQKLADNIGGYIAMLDASEPISEYDEAEMNLQHDLNVSNTRYQNSDPLKQQTPAPETLTHSARRAADELDLRLEPINKDEDDAANRIDPAFKRC
jgi:hypothetical protein